MNAPDSGPEVRLHDLLAAASSASNGQRREGGQLRPLGKKAARTRNLLLRAATDCFVKAGYRSTTVQDIHRAAGVSLGTFYQYFHDKADVMATIVGERILRASSELFPPIDLEAEAGSLRHAVEAFVRSYAETADFQRVWEEVTHFDDDLAALRWDLSSLIEGSMAAAIARGQASGHVDPAVDPVVTARALSAMVDRYCYLTFVVAKQRDDASVTTAVDALTILWENALRVR